MILAAIGTCSELARRGLLSVGMYIIHVPSGVSSRKKCGDLSVSLRQVYIRLLILTALFHGG